MKSKMNNTDKASILKELLGLFKYKAKATNVNIVVARIILADKPARKAKPQRNTTENIKMIVLPFGICFIGLSKN